MLTTMRMAGVALVGVTFFFAATAQESLPAKKNVPVPAQYSEPYVVDISRLTHGFNTGFDVVVRGLSRGDEKEREARKKWVLYFDGEPIPSMTPVVLEVPGLQKSDPTQNPDIVFRYEFNHEARELPSWRNLFSRARYFHPVDIGVNPASGSNVVKPLSTSFKALMIPTDRLLWIGAGYALIVFCVFAAGRRSEMLKEEGLYSLGRSQMAIWFLLVLGAYLFIGIVIGSWTGTVGGQALSLMGISAATGVAAAAISGDKRASLTRLAASVPALQAQIASLNSSIANPANTAALPTLSEQLKTAQLEFAQAQAAQSLLPSLGQSQGFWKDIASDANGVSLHRVQIIAWTAVCSLVFIARVASDLVMPEFDPNMLILMGISSGTYLGFKMSEKA